MRAPTTEAAWQEQVIDLLKIHGWRWLHVRRSLGKRNGRSAWQTTTNIKGWPDLFCWHPVHGFLALELKSPKGLIRPEQLDVMHELATAGARTMIARPADLDEVERWLRGKA